jgi:hypothetical protein
MRMWTNTLIYPDFHTAMRRARISYPPMGSLWFDALQEHGARNFKRRFDVRLIGEKSPAGHESGTFSRSTTILMGSWHPPTTSGACSCVSCTRSTRT